MKTLKTYKQLYENTLNHSYKSTYLYEIEEGTTRLVCTNSNLTKIPELPEGIEEINCSFNDLHELPELPESLEILICIDNKINELPELPIGMKSLLCSDNNLPYEDLEGYWKWFYEYYPIHYPEKYELHMMKKNMDKYGI